MRKTKTGLVPVVDALESRWVLSTATPLLSRHAMSGVVHEIKAIVNTLARTDNKAQASAQLASLSSEISSGSANLAAAWQIDLGLYRPHSARSAISTQQRILGELRRLVEAGNQPASVTGSTPTTPSQGTGYSDSSGTTTNNGQGSSGTSTPAPEPEPSVDSVKIENTTGLALVVTIYLDDSQNPLPYITETIPAGESSPALFNFGTSTGAFMTMNVSRADGLQSPAPFDNIQLSQPLGGYDGTLFTISLLGPYFNVSFS